MRITQRLYHVARRLALAAIAGTATLAPVSSIASAQTPALPQIHLLSELQFSRAADEMYLCSGTDWEECKSAMDTNIQDEFYESPEQDSLGGAQVRQSQIVDLGGVPVFVLYVQYVGMSGPYWEAYHVVVTQQPVPVTSLYTGTLRATGAWTSMNGVTVTQGEPIFEVIVSPGVVDLNLWLLTMHLPQPGAPGVALSVTTYRADGRSGP